MVMWSDSSEAGGGGKDVPPPKETENTSISAANRGGEAEAGALPHEDVTGGLKGSFEQQQVMIGQLRDILKHKEEGKTREKEMEDYATRLAKMKPRLLRGKGRGRFKDKEESSHRDLIQATPNKPATTEEQPKVAFQEPILDSPVDSKVLAEEDSSNPTQLLLDTEAKPVQDVPIEPVKPSPHHQESGSRSKILLLRKQLEENRLKFDRQQRENVDKRAAMEDMKDRISKLRTEVEERDTVIQSLQEVDSLQHSDPNIQHLYQQIMHKDNTILDLSDQVTQLENTTKDQEEHLNEKDQIIAARTEAVSLITKDRDEKMIKTIEELEEVKYAMKEMQKLFTNKEEEWRNQETSFENCIEEKNKKLTVLEQNCHRIENVRFELSTRNAELQEKIVTLQCDCKDLKEQFNEAKCVILQKSEDIDQLKKKLVRAEAFGQKKLKSLEKQIKAISEDSNLGNKIVELQNQIAELEEEKGNLQLKLVDFDELKSQNEKLSESLTSSGLKIEQLNSEILSQITTVSQFDKEKIKLVEELNCKDLRINSLEETSSQYKKQFVEVTQGKVTLELRLCEIEEERDLALKHQKYFENEQMKVDSSLSAEIQVKTQNKELEEKMLNLRLQLEEREAKALECENILSEKENLLKSMEETVEEKVDENQCLISFLAENESLVSSQSLKIEKHDSVVQGLQEELSSKENDITNFILQSNNLQLEVDELKKQLNESETTVNQLNKQMQDLQNEIAVNKKNITSLKANEKSLDSILSEKENALHVIDGEINYLKEELKEREILITNQINRIENIDGLLQSREKQILNLESEIADKLREKAQQQTKCEKYEKELKKLKHSYQDMESKLKAECETVACLLSDKDNQIKVLEHDASIKVRELNNSEQMVSNFEQEACEKNKAHDVLLEERNLLLSELNNLKRKLDSAESDSEIEKLDIDILQQSLSEKDNQIGQMKGEISNSLLKLKSEEENILSMETANERLQEEVSEFKRDIESREISIKDLQVQFQNYVASKEIEISQMHEAINGKELEVNSLKDALSSFTGETSMNIEHMEKEKLELTDKLQRVAVLENELLAKAEEIQQLHIQIESNNESISQFNMHLNDSRNESEQYQKQTQELMHNIEQFMQQKVETDSHLESLNKTLTEKDQDIVLLQNEMENKNAMLIRLQNEAEVSSAKFMETENIQGYISQLQEELNIKSDHLRTLNENFESLLKEKELRFTELQKEFENCKIQLYEKQTEILNLQTSCDNTNKESETNLQELHNKFSKLEADKNNYEQQISDLKQKSDDDNILYNNLMIQYESISKQILKKDEELSNLQSNFSAMSFRDPSSGIVPESLDSEHKSSKTYEEENNNLKKELEEAQQAIIRLETSLATQSFTQESSSPEGSDGWGIVDLGEPSIAEPPPLSMQTSLMEKDKTLTVIQEQLKIALEEVNTTNDEKKILKHQMNTLEAELSHKDKKITSLEAHVRTLESKATELTSTFSEVTHQTEEMQNIPVPIEARQAQLHSQMDPTSFVASHFEGEISEAESTAASWFEAKSVEGSNEPFFDIIGSNSSNDQVHAAPADKDIIPEQQERLVESESIKKNEESVANPSEPSMQEVLYKLSWYEENWPAWTEHYNQLQMSFETATQETALLNQEFEVLKNTNASLREKEKEVEAKLIEFEESITTQTEENLSLRESIKALEAENTVALSSLRHDHESKHEEAILEINKLKAFETQVYELQGELQTLQYQCSVLESKTADAEMNSLKVREYETLYGELQSCMQESETKREGSKSRVQELELMVQSAESEIARLRSDMQKLQSAGDALEEERIILQEQVDNLKQELKKNVSERESFENENDRLQREAASLHSQSVELQTLSERNHSEIEQLKSEVEVLAGENDRIRSNFEIMEAESHRLRNDNEILTQNNQIAVAEKESLETETQRLVEANSSLAFERDHIRGEMQRLTEVATSAESEITRLKMEIETMSSLSSSYHELETRYTELQERFGELEDKQQRGQTQELGLEEVDWVTEAKIEDEHLQRSSSVERQLHDELSQLKEKIIALEKEKNAVSEDLQATKLKNGKMIQKLKASNNKNENLMKEMQKLKKKAGGFSDLDLALEEEWSSQVAKAEKERGELKIKLDEVEKEKGQLLNRLDVLETAQDKYFEMKESQDASIRQISSRNKNLESQIASLEWKLSELEESLEESQGQQKEEDNSAPPTSTVESNADSQQTVNNDSMIEKLKEEQSLLEEQVKELKLENLELKNVNNELRVKLNDLSNENEVMQSRLEDLRDAKSKADTNANTYKTSFLELHTEHETLQENYAKDTKTLENLQHVQDTLKVAYDSLYEDYHQLKDNRDYVRLELGIIIGERDKLQEEANSLNNQLQALLLEEEEEIIRGLQDECSDLRDQNNCLKDEVTRMTETLREMEETAERTEMSLAQQAEIQEVLQMQIVTKSQESDFNATTVSEQDQEIKYMKAELASLKTKCSQQQQALEQLEPQVNLLKKKLADSKEEKKRLVKQIEVADLSLVKLATGESKEKSEERFSSLEASELEAALSSLHLRDLRCQQLSLEINKLLEERDGLQLKLSAALRQTQDLSRELSLSQQLPSSQTPTLSLSQKLAELRDLNSSLEQKALDSLRVGNTSSGFSSMPPSLPTFISHTAPATPTATRHLDYTVTRENQGASSVIMNWFLGKSTPKEVLHV